MKTIQTLTATQDKMKGFWRIRAGNKTVGAIVQPNYAVALGIPPTAKEIRDAVLELFPALPITPETDVVFWETPQ